MNRTMTKAVAAAALIGFCIVSCATELFLLPSEEVEQPQSQLRRSLAWADYSKRRPPINPGIRNHIKPLAREPVPLQETVIFWHIPKSGGTTLKSIYKCMNKTLSVRVGADPKWGHHKDTELTVFEPGHQGALFVNVDTISAPGILRAKKMGLVESGIADLIVTNQVTFAIENLYDKFHKGRAMALFRHPVERLISKFFYSQIATWERSYKPQLKDIDLLYWAENINVDSNNIVKSLAGLPPEARVTERDLGIAVRTVRARFIVGLMNQMEESIHRFNIFMGVDESEKVNKECMDEYFGHGVKKSNSNSHPKIDEKDPAWQALAKTNSYDLRLYEEVVLLFDEQREVIMSYARSAAD